MSRFDCTVNYLTLVRTLFKYAAASQSKQIQHNVLLMQNNVIILH